MMQAIRWKCKHTRLSASRQFKPFWRHCRLRERCPDLIVLDLDVPVMDGWEFRSEQRYLSDKKCTAVPVLIMTGEDDAGTEANTLRAAGIIKKPFDPDDLLDAVSAAIRSQGAPDGIRSTRAWRKSRQPGT